MKLALNGQSFAATHSLSELLDVLDRFAVKAVELWPANLPGGGTPEEDERYETRDLAAAARLLRARGVEVACVTHGFWAAPICVARGGTGAFAESLCGTVDVAVALGAKLVNCYSTGLPLSVFRQVIIPAARHAAERGVVITLENEAHDESALPGSVAALCAEVGSPGFGTQYDPCNYYHADIEPYPAAYEAVRPYVRYVHLKGGCRHDPAQTYAHRGSPMRDAGRGFIGYLPLTEAAFPVEAILRRLRRDGYEGFVTLEPHVPVEDVPAFYEVEIPYVRRILGEL